LEWHKMKPERFQNTNKCRIMSGIILLVLAIAGIGVWIYISLSHDKGISGLDIKVGVKAPLFNITSVMGEGCSFEKIKGKTILLSFVDTQNTTSEKNVGDNAGQINFLRSMYRQYSSKGLVVWMVDASYINTGKNADKNKLINFTYDWGLKDNFLLIQDKKLIGLSKKYNVKKLPTTFLINGKEIITQRWDYLALSSQLAMAVENLVGYPDYRSTENSNSASKSYDVPDKDGTSAQSKFQGLLPARELSDNIWMVDGGKKWNSTGAYPVKWLVMDTKGNLSMTVTATNMDTNKTITLFEKKTLEAISQKEENVMLNEFDKTNLHVFLLDTSVQVKVAGKYSIKAYIYRKSDLKTQIYTGEAQVNAD
jgi:hypothetical protein